MERIKYEYMKTSKKSNDIDEIQIFIRTIENN